MFSMQSLIEKQDPVEVKPAGGNQGWCRAGREGGGRVTETSGGDTWSVVRCHQLMNFAKLQI